MPNTTLHLQSSDERLELYDTDLINWELNLNRVHPHAVDIENLEGRRRAPLVPKTIARGHQQCGREKGLPRYPKMARDFSSAH
jgi:hypothetical protein